MHVMLFSCLVLLAPAQDKKTDDPVVNGKTVAQWIAELKNADEKRRVTAVSALGRFGPDAKAALPALCDRLKDTSARVRLAAVNALAEVATPADAKVVLPALAGAFKDAKVGVLAAVLHYRLHPKGKEGLAELDRLLQDKKASVRLEAVGGLALTGLTDLATMDRMLRATKDPDVRVRARAAESLGQVPLTRAVAVVPVLRGLLKDPRPEVREAAVGALGPFTLSRAGAAAVAGLRQALADPEPLIRLAAAQRLLNEFPTPAWAALPELRKLLDDQFPLVRLAAAQALWQIDLDPAALPVLHASLAASNAQVRAAAVQMVGELDLDALSFVPLLAKLVAGKDELMRRAALSTVADLGSVAGDALPALRPLLKNKDAATRLLAVRAVAALGPEAAPTLEDVRPLLEDNDSRVRGYALLTLWRVTRKVAEVRPFLTAAMKDDPALVLTVVGEMGSQGKEFAPLLRPLLKHEPASLRLAVAGLLWRLEKDAGPLLAQCRELFPKDDLASNRGLLRTAVGLLRDLGPQAREALPLLRAAVRDADASVRLRAVYALGADPKAPAAVVADLMRVAEQDELDFLREEAVVMLGRLGKGAAAAVPLLQKALKDENARVRCNAAFALWEVTGTAKEPLPVLQGLLQHPDRAVRSGAVTALGNMGTTAKPAAGALRERLKDERLYIRLEAAYSLARVDAGALPAALKVLTDGLRAEAAGDRILAARLLGELGPAARTAATALRKLTEDEVRFVREAARAALAKVEAETKKPPKQ